MGDKKKFPLKEMCEYFLSNKIKFPNIHMLNFLVSNYFYIRSFYWQMPPRDFGLSKNVMLNATKLVQLFQGGFLIIN